MEVVFSFWGINNGCANASIGCWNYSWQGWWCFLSYFNAFKFDVVEFRLFGNNAKYSGINIARNEQNTSY
jgi:hypothetical protein